MMATIKMLGARVEEEHAQHLRERQRIQSQTASYSARPSGVDGAATVSNGEADFASLVAGAHGGASGAPAPAASVDPWDAPSWGSAPVRSCCSSPRLWLARSDPPLPGSPDRLPLSRLSRRRPLPPLPRHPRNLLRPRRRPAPRGSVHAPCLRQPSARRPSSRPRSARRRPARSRLLPPRALLSPPLHSLRRRRRRLQGPRSPPRSPPSALFPLRDRRPCLHPSRPAPTTTSRCRPPRPPCDRRTPARRVRRRCSRPRRRPPALRPLLRRATRAVFCSRRARSPARRRRQPRTQGSSLTPSLERSRCLHRARPQARTGAKATGGGSCKRRAGGVKEVVGRKWDEGRGSPWQGRDGRKRCEVRGSVVRDMEVRARSSEGWGLRGYRA